jgi:two-component sensor histidine kinase
LHLNIEIKKLGVEMALPLGLIINEWVTNAFKHAYKNVQYPMLALSLKGGNKIQLEIQDNGPGLSNEVWEKPRHSFGIKLIKVLSKQLNGECKIMYENGTKFILAIPVKQYKRKE